MDTSHATALADRSTARSMGGLRRGSRRDAWVRPLVACVLLAGVLAGCVTQTSDGGEVIVSEDDRVFEVRSARVALAEPVPALMGEVDRVVDAAQRVWGTPEESDQRARLAVALDLEPLRAAARELGGVEVVGGGPDVVATRAVLTRMVERADGVAEQVAVEMAEVAATAEVDAELDALVQAWDEPGSFSQQVTLFQETADAAAALSTTLAARTAVVPCTELWSRRAQAATVLEQRTLELRDLIRNRDGELFDETRSAFRQDPFGLQMRLGEADAAAAGACWAQESSVAAASDDMSALVAELSATLDPQELRS